MSRGPWTMKIGFDPYFLQFLGRVFGKDQGDYLVCKECGNKYMFKSSTLDLPKRCSCGEELLVHMPDSEMMVIRWRVWKAKQKWWPQRYSVWPTKNERGERDPYRYWAFFGREWFKRPDPRPDWWDEEDESTPPTPTQE